MFVVIRGDLEVNEAKLRVAAGVSALEPASAEQIAAAGAVAGYASPVGLSVLTKQDERPRTAIDRTRTSHHPFVLRPRPGYS